ncbi:MAG: isoprenylcysteine carboxylmethyltransferase family protein [Candidatus Thorarchaeota archaeon]|nr:isoprenylcysteine carboxylmethyltransferase family protein [Candidatus Thorarchaeota archaeon]
MLVGNDQEKKDEEHVVSSKNPEGNKPLRERFFDTAGWLMVFFQSVPALFIWGGLMTLPFLLYLLVMFFSLGSIDAPLVTERGNLYFLEAINTFLFGGNRIPEIVVSCIGLFILLYSVLYLRFRKPEGLVTSGPYRFVRHPQYLGVIVFTANLTSRSFRETLGDLGWLGPEWTFLIWFGTLIAYILLASMEESHLFSKFGEQYNEYRGETGFIFPFLKTKRMITNVAITIILAILLLFGTVYLAELMHP